MQIRCPHCHNGIDLVEDSDFQSVNCPSCGSEFGLVDVDEDDIATLGQVDSDGRLSPQSDARGTYAIGHFQLITEIGRGAFGSVWRAEDTKLDRMVAVKVPRPGRFTSETAEFFLREARSAAQLNHPNIVSIHEIGRHDDRIYIVSDLIEGESLDRLLASRRWSASEAVELCITIADALQHAHARGVIHRDLKPGNILLDGDDRPYLTDFGLAKRDAGEITMTVAGKILGTPAYMPPEQARGEGHHVDRRGDIYSLGVILYELLCGELPFRGTTEMLLHQVIHEEAASPRKLNHSIPRDLETITLKCLEKDPARRYSSASELADDLGRWLSGKPIHARPLGQFQKSWRWARRKPAAAALVSVSSAAVSVFLVAGIIYNRQLQREFVRAEANEQKAQDALSSVEREREDARRDERAARERAEASLHVSRVESYVGDMILAQLYQEQGNRESVQSLLDLHRDDQQLRGFEWHFWDRRIHGEATEIPCDGHVGAVHCLAFSPDGRWLASASADHTVRLWTASSGTPLRTLTGHSAAVNAVAFDPSGRYLASGGNDGQVRIHDTSRPNDDKFYTPHEGSVTALAYLGDSNHLATAGADGKVHVWDTETGETYHLLVAHEGTIHCLAYHPAEDLPYPLLASGGDDSIARIWDAKTGELLHTLKNHNLAVTSVAFSQDGGNVVTGSNDQTAIRWRTDNGDVLSKMAGHSGSIQAVASHRRVATGSHDSTVKLWVEASDRSREVITLKGHETKVTSLAFNYDGGILASGSEDGIIKLWLAQPTRESGP